MEIRLFEGYEAYLLTYEVSLLTILYPEGFDCVTGRSDMICDRYAICGELFVICVLCMSWAGRRLYYGPEGNMLWAGRQYVV